MDIQLMYLYNMKDRGQNATVCRRGGYEPPARNRSIGLAYPSLSRAPRCGRLIAALTDIPRRFSE